jgi:hypothetical protein
MLRTFKFSQEISIFILVFSLATGTYSTEVSAKSSACQKEYARVSRIKAPHMAVATSLGLPLDAKDISCGFSAATTKRQAVRDAVNSCKKNAKKYGKSTRCRVIEAR